YQDSSVSIAVIGLDLYAFIAAAIQCVGRFGTIYGFRRIRRERRQPTAYQQQQQQGASGASQLQSYQNPADSTDYDANAPKRIGEGFSDLAHFQQRAYMNK
ncbi:unnamed protein product, partial [Toxocara canis]|uniref:G_PROTEIN_RECEP_F1_2 domain-containing protein n=1 Tax=Toxocara canis TaxID=6265 RepID=A0A183UDD2_TOXCA